NVAQIAPAQDDPRRREQRRDKPQKEDVVRHLVDYANRSVPERLQRFHMAVGEPPGKSRVPILDLAAPIVRRKRLPNFSQCMQFAGAEHARMARGDLLDEARTRARHTDDEYRRLRWVAPRRGSRKEIGRREFDEIVHLPSQRADIETFAGLRPLLPMKSIGVGKARKRLIAPFGVVQQYA